MKKALILLVLLLVLTTSACTHALEVSSVNDRIADIDAYKQSRPTPTPLAVRLGDIGETDGEHFRSVPYGASMQDVLDTETLPLVKEYTDAIDYEATEVFLQQMTTTYWFNESQQLYRGAYYMQSETIDPPISDLYALLSEVYGEPLEVNFYSYDDELLDLDFEQGIQAISNDTAYYYINFNNYGIDIELYVRTAEESTPEAAVYDIYMFFTDYTFY